jgi:hypothetical protein
MIGGKRLAVLDHPEIARFLQAQAFLLLGHRTSEPALHRRDRPHFARAQELVLDAHAVALTRCLPLAVYSVAACPRRP